jgi:catalase (peroxidase I)
LRFPPEATGDPQIYGLSKVAALLLSKVAARHPRLSQADLWVLAAYAAVEALGGPRIGFVGGRFDARDARRAPFGDAPAYQGVHAGAAKVYNAVGSRLLPLDLGPMEVGAAAPKGCAAHVREAPTAEAFRRHAARLGFSDRELVVLLLGGNKHITKTENSLQC